MQNNTSSIWGALSVAAALMLTGCSVDTQTPGAATQDAPEPSRVIPTAMPSPPPSAVGADAEAVKASAIAAGRPSAAFDKDCQVWSAPKGDAKRQAWANKLGNTWLGEHSAGCPDAITFPFYFVEAWTSPQEGELKVLVDNFIRQTDGTGPSSSNLSWVAENFMCELYDEAPDLTRVVAVTADGKQTAATTRTEFQNRGDFQDEPNRSC